MTVPSLTLQRQRLVESLESDQRAFTAAVDQLKAATLAEWNAVRSTVSLESRFSRRPVTTLCCAFLVGAWLGYRRRNPLQAR